jgi:phosphate transport system substrate-binding protein
MKNKFLLVLTVFFCCETFLFSSGNKQPDPVADLVLLADYIPFHSSKLASLEKRPAFSLTGDLPVLDGATALFPVYASFVQAVYPKAEFNKIYKDRDKFDLDQRNKIEGGFIRCTTTPAAYRSLINREVDIIFCMEPSKEQVNEAARNGIKLNMTPIGKDAFVFFVNIDNPINNITSDQIRKIYSGQITNWKELSGKDEEIIAYQRNKDSGSQTLLESIMGETPIMDPPLAHAIGTMSRVITKVAAYNNYPNAIGYSFLFYTAEMVKNKKIKLLSIDGVMPSRETIKSGKYIFSNTFYAITAGNEKENAKKFINWILSTEGQYLVEKTGYVPIK